MKLAKYVATVLASFGLMFTAGASTDDSGTIRLVVGYSPGGATDTLARLIAEELRTELNQSVLVENRAGGQGRIAVDAVKTVGPDGDRFLLGPNGQITFKTMLSPMTRAEFDPINDLTPVAGVVSYPLAFAVTNDLGVKTMKEYVDWLRKNPNRNFFGTAGFGGHTHFSGLQLGTALEAALAVVPYKGNGPLLTDLRGGQVPAAILVAGDVLPFHKTGQVQILGVFSPKRSTLLPDVPTITEAGFPILAGDAWMGVWASRDMPAAKRDRMEAALKNVMAKDSVRTALANSLSMEVDFRSAPEMLKRQTEEMEHWSPLIKASGIQLKE